MIKLVVFDLDGVLIDSKQTHYEALNRALGREYAISIDEHLSTYDGLPTRTKLNGYPRISMLKLLEQSRVRLWTY